VRSVVQRVSRAEVTVGERAVGRIGPGLLVFVGVAKDDGPSDIEYTASKILGLRVFPDEAGRMNRSIVDTGGDLLVVSQFTLFGDARKGRRPSFDAAAPPDAARTTYGHFVQRLRASGLVVLTGEFQAHMDVSLVNDGPVTLLLESRRLF
jgi:D-tyrosyl-tRNA(Tyr) deacylase